MSFHGYFFNKHRQKYLTNKYPHCWIGIIQKLGGGDPFWGNYSKLFTNSVYWGDYSGGIDVEHTVNLGNVIRSNIANDWDVMVEDTWHEVVPGGVRSEIGDMCDASFNLLTPGNIAITLWYKAVIPSYSFDPLCRYNAMTDTGAYNRVSTLNHGAYIGTPGLQGVSGNTYRASVLAVSDAAIQAHPEYAPPTNAQLNQTSALITSFPDGNSILNSDLDITHSFNNVQKYVREQDRAFGSISSVGHEFLGVNFHGGSGSKMITYSYDINPTNNVKANVLSYSVNHHLELFNVPHSVPVQSGTETVYMLPELFKPFMMIMPNQGGNIGTTGQMALYCVFGVKEIP